MVWIKKLFNNSGHDTIITISKLVCVLSVSICFYTCTNNATEHYVGYNYPLNIIEIITSENDRYTCEIISLDTSVAISNENIILENDVLFYENIKHYRIRKPNSSKTFDINEIKDSLFVVFDNKETFVLQNESLYSLGELRENTEYQPLEYNGNVFIRLFSSIYIISDETEKHLECLNLADQSKLKLHRALPSFEITKQTNLEECNPYLKEKEFLIEVHKLTKDSNPIRTRQISKTKWTELILNKSDTLFYLEKEIKFISDLNYLLIDKVLHRYSIKNDTITLAYRGPTGIIEKCYIMDY